MPTHLHSPTKLVNDYLLPTCTINGLPASSKKKVLESIAKTMAMHVPNIQEISLFNSLVQREKLGSTAIGHGCALPHCRTMNIDQAYASFFKLSRPVDFDAPDKKGVDLIFSLIVPEDATNLHLSLLANIAELLNNATIRAGLRHAKSNEELYQILLTK